MNKASQIAVLAFGGAGAFALALQWSRGGADEAADIVAAAPRPAATAVRANSLSAAEATATGSTTALSVPATRIPPRPGGSAFEPLSWKPAPPPPPPPPPAAPAPPPPPPKAPPLPFSFVGMVERGTERTEAYLAKGDALLIVGVGDEIENKTYRVDSLSPTGVVLTYLPMSLQQTVNAPGVKP